MANYGILDRSNIKSFKCIMPAYVWELATESEVFFTIGATEDSVACGYMLVEHNDMGYIIHDLFVHPMYRRRGIATGFIYTLVAMASLYLEDIDCDFMLPQDEDFRLLLESTGLFEIDDENKNVSKVYRGNVDAFYSSQFIKPMFKLDPYKEGLLDFYDELAPAVKKKFITDCMEHNYLPTYGIPVNREQGNKYCFVTTDKGGQEVNSYIKADVDGDTAYLESAWCKKGAEKKLMVLVATVAKELYEDPNVKYIETCVVEESVESLLKRIAPNLEVISEGVSAYWNYKDIEEVTK